MSYDPKEITGGSASRDLLYSRSWPKEMSDRIKFENMPQITAYFSSRYNNLTPRQIEAEYSTLFDDVVARDGVITPDVARNFEHLLKERLDASSGVRGERLGMGKSNRLDNGKSDRLGLPLQSDPYAPSSKKQDLIRVLKARQGRRTYGGPR